MILVHIYEMTLFILCEVNELDTLEDRAVETAQYIVETRCTVREAAKRFGVSKSTVHKDVTHRLKEIDKSLYSAVEKIMQFNKEQRHIRGGMATKRKYEMRKKRESL